MSKAVLRGEIWQGGRIVGAIHEPADADDVHNRMVIRYGGRWADRYRVQLLDVRDPVRPQSLGWVDTREAKAWPR